MSTIKANSSFKFENTNDYVSGLSSMIEMLDKWVEKADNGYERKYQITEHSDAYKFDLTLEVTPHNN